MPWNVAARKGGMDEDHAPLIHHLLCAARTAGAALLFGPGPGGRDGPQKLPLQPNGTAVRQRGRRRGKKRLQNRQNAPSLGAVQDGGQGRFPGCLPLKGLTAARDAA